MATHTLISASLMDTHFTGALYARIYADGRRVKVTFEDGRECTRKLTIDEVKEGMTNFRYLVHKVIHQA